MKIETETWPLRVPFRISGYTFDCARTVVVTLHRNGYVGRGEAAGAMYRNDTPERIVAQLSEIKPKHDLTRNDVQLLPAGGARNALDCALWELEARESGRPVWQLAGMDTPHSLLTTCTVGADDPETMASRA